MRAVRIVLSLAVVVAAHSLLLRIWPEFPRLLDLFLIWTALVGLSGSSLAGLLGGLAAGLTHDALSGGPFGLHGFADTLAGYGTARLAQRLVIQRAASVILLLAGISLVQQLVLAGVSLLTLPAPILPESPLWLIARALLSGVVGGAIFLFRELWRSSSEMRKRQRVRRLKMD